MDEKPKGNRLLELNKELWASEGNKVVIRLYKFNQILKIFLSNYSELETAVAQHVSGSRLFDIRDTQKRKQIDDELFEILRHLHNTVAAALSLVDHTRTFYKEFYQENGLIPEYQKQIDNRFANDGLSQFVQCLRQFCQHYRTPLVSSILEIDNKHGNHTRGVHLLKSDLTEFSSWKAHAKEYINGLPENVDLLEVMKSYRDHVVKFHDWFNQQLSELHRAD